MWHFHGCLSYRISEFGRWHRTCRVFHMVDNSRQDLKNLYGVVIIVHASNAFSRHSLRTALAQHLLLAPCSSTHGTLLSMPYLQRTLVALVVK